MTVPLALRKLREFASHEDARGRTGLGVFAAPAEEKRRSKPVLPSLQKPPPRTESGIQKRKPVAARPSIRIGSEYQACIPSLLWSSESSDRGDILVRRADPSD